MRVVALIVLLTFFILNLSALHVYADAKTDAAIGKGINYLGTQLNGATGQITGGSTGDASPWAAVAFSANGIDLSTVKTSTHAPSVITYLQNNHPTTSSSVTEWEKWTLAIVASGQNPYSFGGINYVTTLQSAPYYNNHQIGDPTTENDDWFGVMALVSSGVATSDAELTDSLSFILAHQNADGGFGYSTTAGSDGNDTAAAIQALVAAKNYGVVNGLLDTGLNKAKTYLLSTQDKSGGFLYDTNPWTTTPDSDSTTWALMALNVLAMQNSDETGNARTWLLSQQSPTDGGFTACNQWDPTTFACTGYASNSTTTAHALIGLSGKGWIIQSFNTSSQTSSATTPSPSVVSPTPSSTPTPTVVLTVTPMPTSIQVATPTITSSISSRQPISLVISPAPVTGALVLATDTNLTPEASPTTEVLGAQDQKAVTQTVYRKNTIAFVIVTTLGIVFLLFYATNTLKRRKK